MSRMALIRWPDNDVKYLVMHLSRIINSRDSFERLIFGHFLYHFGQIRTLYSTKGSSRNSKTQQSLDLCLKKSSDYLDVIVFVKPAPFSKCFSSTLKRDVGVFRPSNPHGLTALPLNLTVDQRAVGVSVCPRSSSPPQDRILTHVFEVSRSQGFSGLFFKTSRFACDGGWKVCVFKFFGFEERFRKAPWQTSVVGLM